MFLPPVFATGFAYQSSFVDSSGQRESSVANELATVPAQVDVGLTQTHLAFVDELSINYDPLNRPIVQYRVGQAAVAQADLVSLRLDYAAQKGSRPHRWTLHRAPAGEPALQFPQLPAFTAATSAPYDSLFNGYRITLSDYDGIDGYADVRAAPRVPPKSLRIRRTTMKRP